MASFLYTHYKKAALSGAVNLLTNTVKVMLVNSTYSPQVDASSETTHAVTGDIKAYEVAAGGGYAPGGLELTSRSLTQDNVDKEGVFDAADAVWSSSTITASGAVVYISGGSSYPANGNTAGNIGQSYLVAFVDFGGNQSSSNGTFQISWNSEGIINFT
jgi:hypothetical protein